MLVYGGAHHPDLWTPGLMQGCAGLLSSLGVLLFRQLLVGPKGLWGNKTPPAQHFVPKLHSQQSFHSSTP